MSSRSITSPFGVFLHIIYWEPSIDHY